MSVRYLIFNVSTEYESLLAVLRWSDKDIEDAKKRMALFRAMVEKDTDLMGLEYSDGATLYEYSSANSDWMDEHFGHLSQWANDLWTISDVEPPFDDERGTEFTYSHVQSDYVYWTIRPKHSTEEVETRAINLSDTKLFPESASSDEDPEPPDTRGLLRDVVDSYDDTGCEDCGVISADVYEAARKAIYS
jgi:hypothetical protein